MQPLVERILAQIDQKALDNYLDQLRTLDKKLDQKIEDVHAAQQNVTLWDRVNIFTISDAEFELKEENRAYREIRLQHGEVTTRIKGIIRDTLFKDFGVALKVQSGEILKAINALSVEHRYGSGVRTHRYRIRGIDHLQGQLRILTDRINSEFGFPAEPIDADQLLNLVYEEILRRGKFIA